MKNICRVLLFFIPFYASAQDAREIIRKADEHARGTSSLAEMNIVTTRPKWTRTLELKAWTKGNDFAIILVQKPAKDKGTVFLKRKKEVWNWLPSLERHIKLPPSMMSQAWMGTDFTNDDLVKESSMVNDYDHTLLGSEPMEGRDCYKIQMIPKPEAAIVWGKVLIWVDKKDFLQLRVEFYDEDGKQNSVMIGSDVKMLGGRLLPSKLTMIPAEKPGQKTEIIYKSLNFSKPMDDGFFTPENMTKVN